MSLEVSQPHINAAQILAQITNQGVSAETMMLQVQMMVAKDFDAQLQHIGEQIKFLNQVKKKYRENINKIQQFMSQNVNKTRKDGKNFYDASFAQMAELYGSVVKIDYNLEEMKMTGETGIQIEDNGDKHELDEAYLDIKNGEFSSQDLVSYFNEGANIKDPKEASEFAQKVCSDDGNLPFYVAKKEYSFEGGSPKFAVYEEPLNKMLAQIENYMKDVEEKAEELGVTLNQLTAQRKSAIDELNLLLRKIEEMKSNTISKI